MKLLLTCILKDDSELPMATRMLDSFMPFFDGLAVCINGTTGRTEGLKALIKKHGGQFVRATPDTNPELYHNGKFAHFAEARNLSFKLASEMQKEGKYDYWSWADVDDVIVNGEELKVCAEKSAKLGADGVFFTYWYSVNVDAKGNVTSLNIDHLRERLLRPNVFKWVSRLHEVAVPIDGNYEPKWANWDLSEKEGRFCRWIHLTNTERAEEALKRNITLLELQREDELKQGKDDPRTIFYIAKTLYDLKRPEDYAKIEDLLKQYLQKSGWAEERSFACEYLGNLYCLQGRHRDARDAYFEASKQFGNRHMQYLLIAREYYELDLLDEAKHWLSVAMKMPPPTTRTTIGNPLEVQVMAASISYNLAIREQNLDEAIKWLEIRQTLMGVPDDGMLKTLKDARLLNDAANWVFSYARWLKDNGHLDRLPSLLASLPLELGREAFAYHLANEITPPRIWADNEIAYFASFGSPHFEQWSGKSLSKGIGGSETAVIELARRWVRKGYKVTVYCDPREDEGEIDGVTYKPYYTINWKDKFNILILWRHPYFLDRVESAKKIFLDMHDVCSQLDFTPERMAKVDKVFFKSNYHRKMIPQLPDEKAAVIGNGIDI